MTEAVPRDINDEGPSLLGSPQMSAFRAYRHVTTAHPLVSDEESDILGAAIYEGNLSAERLADAEHPLLVDEYFNHEKSVEVGLQAPAGLWRAAI